MRVQPSLVLLALGASLALGAAAQPVQYFRSDGGLAPAGAGPLPAQFDAPGALVWRQPLDPGHSTPILHGGSIFLTTFQEQEERLWTLALDQNSGALLWKQPAPANRIEPYHRTGSPAAPTPICDGEQLYVFFGSFGLLCYDLDGRLLWEHPLGPFQDEFGAGGSPILAGDKIIILRDQDAASFLMAVDRMTGRTVWRTERPAAVRSYSTPVLWQREHGPELLVAGALELTAYDPATGERLWWVNGLARIVIPAPVIHQDTILMASWSPGADGGGRISLDSWEQALAKWDRDGDGRLAKSELTDREVLSRFYRMDLDQDGYLDQQEWERHSEVFRLAQNAVLALKPEGRGDLTENALLWKYHRGVPYVSTPVHHGGTLWMVRDGGIVTALNSDNGEVLHEERIPGFGSYYASPVVGDGKIYFASEFGVVSVVANRPEWQVVSSHDFKERIYATPVIAGNRIYIRTGQALYCFQGE